MRSVLESQPQLEQADDLEESHVATLSRTYRIDGHLSNLDRMIRLTALADTKAAPLLAVNATIAAVSVTQIGNLQDLLDNGNAAQVASVWVLAAVYVFFALLSAMFSVRVFLPNDKPGHGSTLYFADIAR